MHFSVASVIGVVANSNERSSHVTNGHIDSTVEKAMRTDLPPHLMQRARCRVGWPTAQKGLSELSALERRAHYMSLEREALPDRPKFERNAWGALWVAKPAQAPLAFACTRISSAT